MSQALLFLCTEKFPNPLHFQYNLLFYEYNAAFKRYNKMNSCFLHWAAFYIGVVLCSDTRGVMLPISISRLGRKPTCWAFLVVILIIWISTGCCNFFLCRKKNKTMLFIKSTYCSIALNAILRHVL